eukprot:TRINITY_DN19432_c0_g1_i2.p1 TRINITY_DN19432_c0_g1~~TRINITY_DN19432_c0_g1_i2.p1  ORF type:complete len:613 (+),score=102.56 TRINITY_DN19432_c0_g1_i2:96-1934(+)
MTLIALSQNFSNLRLNKHKRVLNRRGINALNKRKVIVPQAALQDVILPVLFFTPGICIVAYAFFRGKGNLRDGFAKFVDDVSAGYLQPDVGGKNIPTADGTLSDLSGNEPLFVPLQKWFLEYGGVYKLSFGPKAFIVVSDPLVVKHLLKDNAMNYDKGVLAEILEPIMGKGLIPADLETWKPRRRAIVPAFHKAYLDAMIQMFVKCTREAVKQLNDQIEKSAFKNGGYTEVDMEQVFLSLGLDIIGLGVFNFDFGSMKSQSPVIQAVYGVLKEAEHRSTFYLPYWNLPFASEIFPQQRQFQKDLKVINDCLDGLIRDAKSQATEEDLEALQNRDYSKVNDPSLLRFLVDLRGEDATDKQLRDDLMTMLIAGHETTAAVLTWALYLISKNQQYKQKVIAEIDAVFENGIQQFGLEEIQSLPLVRNTLSESLRLYPQPPILIRRALDSDVLPAGLNGVEGGYPIGRGADLFISTWNLHRSPQLWENPDDFDPDRFTREYNGYQETYKYKWDGFQPSDTTLYPNETQSNFAFVPFGGGMRKCVGDQFAMFEATVAFAILLKEFNFEFREENQDVGMATGATIHTRNGLWMRVSKREQKVESEVQSAVESKEDVLV